MVTTSMSRFRISCLVCLNTRKIFGRKQLQSIISQKSFQFVRGMAADVNKFLTIDNMNPHLIPLQHAEQGPVATRVLEIEKDLEKGVKKPFTKIIKASHDDSQALGQVPITFVRQALASAIFPKLLNDPHFPGDVKSRIREILKECKGGSIGSYSDSPGLEVIRRHVAAFIDRRDKSKSTDWQNVVLTSGATNGIATVLKLFDCTINGKKPGVMVPIPGYPVYSSLITEYDMHQINYYLDEDKNWGITLSELKRAYDESKKFCSPRVIVIINPGNPAAQVLSKETIADIIRFAHKNKLFIFADEVYQSNVYSDKSSFISFKKVLMEMGKPFDKKELASFMSGSAGFLGECGQRSGYVEIVNICPDVMAMYMKSISAMLCPTLLGQITTEILANPPQPNEPSYNLYMKEKTSILDSLKAKAKMATDAFNSIEGLSCKPIQGAMYAFPKITLPKKALEAAKKWRLEPDVFYTLQLLENTGITVAPGSVFGQKPGTYHFRASILPQTDKLEVMIQKLKEFQKSFLKKYD